MIKSGYLFKTSLKEDKEGNMRVILPKNLSDDGVLDLSELIKIRLEEKETIMGLEENQIVFKAKSTKPAASLIKMRIENTLASHHFFIISLTSEEVIPEYVCWYLNQQPAQSYFRKNAMGSRVPIINKRTLSEIDIPIIDMNSQAKIVKIYNNFMKEKGLTKNLLQLKEKTMSQMLLNFLQGVK